MSIDWRSPMANGTAGRSSEELRDRIGGWLTGDGWRINAITPERAAWGLAADDGSGRIISVAQPEGRPDRIEIFGGVGLSDGHKTKLAAMEAERRQDLLWTLRYEVARLGLAYQGIQEPLGQFAISTTIYQDGLSQDAFCQRVFRVKNGVLLCVWTIRRTLDGPSISAEAAGDVVH